MKKTLFLIFMLAVGATALVAQSLRKTEKINSDQVPVAIRASFETDFGKIPEDGYWTATYIVEREGTRSSARPLAYSFHKRNKSEKIEVRYTADGKLDFAKGLEKKATNT